MSIGDLRTVFVANQQLMDDISSLMQKQGEESQPTGTASQPGNDLIDLGKDATASSVGNLLEL